MTTPTPEGEQRPARRPRTLDVVSYVHTDPILGRPHTGLGVVFQMPSDGESTATVRPLAGHTVQVDPADLTPLTAADLTES